MSVQAQKVAIEEIAKAIDIPDSAYEKAEKRYQDLGEWFASPQAKCSMFSPHIYPQGSFRLGTVTRPLFRSEEYDLDMACRIASGISKHQYSQKDLKELVGLDLERYRQMRQIKEELEAKHRCWCLNYADELSFHMDVVPSIPEEVSRKVSLQKSMVESGENVRLAEAVVQYAGAITDDRLPNYDQVSPHWPVSNSEGYALWFESRMRLEQRLLEKSLDPSIKAKINDLPVYKRRSPLQCCVQILKRHRDIMFANNPSAKPASIIITTLAARAYQGESDVVAATQNALLKMGNMVNPAWPRIPNPINPEEDFADRWYAPQNQQLQLEQNFFRWLNQAIADLATLGSAVTIEELKENSMKSFGTSLDGDQLRKALAGRATASALSSTRVLSSAQATVASAASAPRPLKDNPYF